ncbi:transposase, partial [Loigolactobacillus rennini]|uniref:transposase n=1 Tax=Loigolactobacillus rennini TaxID=238013 RepID=UPI000A788442
HQLIDVLPFRTIHRLEKHFKRYDQTAREKVKIIVTDMNYTYPQLTQTIFPNAIVVIDKFHLTNALNRAFNQTRVRIMKQFAPSSREFKALKRYWKLLLIPHEQL